MPQHSQELPLSLRTMNSPDPEKEATDVDAVPTVSRSEDAETGVVEFDPVACRALRSRIDIHIIPTVAMLYLFCFIDRANIGNARIAGLDRDLKLQGYDYNIVLSSFYVSYIIFEIPATVMCKYLGPGWFLPLTTLCFGICSISTAFVHSRASICVVRFLLGIFEAGMLPGIAFYLTRWYCRAELTFRLALYMVMSPLAGAFGGLFASAILKADHFGMLKDWRMIFAIEGIITVAISLYSFFSLTDRPESARWLTPDEKELCVARVMAERTGQTQAIDGIDWKKLLRGMSCPVTMHIAVLFLFNNITVQGLAFFLPTIVSSIYPESSIVHKQLLSVPPYVVGAVFSIVFPAVSWYLDRRQLLIAASAPTVMAGYVMFLGSDDASVRYAACFLIASTCMVLGSLCNAHISANIVGDTARSSAIGLNVMLGNIGGLISTWAYPAWDSPGYRIGSSINLAAATSVLFVGLGGYVWLSRDNKRRARRSVEDELANMSSEKIALLDWKHPAFRWKL
ncbi:Fc.00g009310.m01.CDS01 [Cosmosporella sp. VM-42]